MNKEDKLKIASTREIKSNWIQGEEKVISKIYESKENGKIVYMKEMYKYNSRGWKNKRKVFLTKNWLINTDGKSEVKSHQKSDPVEEC